METGKVWSFDECHSGDKWTSNCHCWSWRIPYNETLHVNNLYCMFLPSAKTLSCWHEVTCFQSSPPDWTTATLLASVPQSTLNTQSPMCPKCCSTSFSLRKCKQLSKIWCQNIYAYLRDRGCCVWYTLYTVQHQMLCGQDSCIHWAVGHCDCDLSRWWSCEVRHLQLSLLQTGLQHLTQHHVSIAHTHTDISHTNSQQQQQQHNTEHCIAVQLTAMQCSPPQYLVKMIDNHCKTSLPKNLFTFSF